MASGPFTATYDGYCGGCGDSILWGDTIRMHDGEPICEACYDEGDF